MEGLLKSGLEIITIPLGNSVRKILSSPGR